ncbi:MAG: Fic family protein [Pseudomonadota bacterium]|nr:Fic family protein [Pseudomonadota bacterium]
MMSKSELSNEIENILEVLKLHPKGISTIEILEIVKSNGSKRTLLRRLDSLIEAGQIEKIGIARAVRYRIKDQNTLIIAQSPIDSQSSLSNEGDEIKAYVTQDIIQRKPVKYQREFLEEYIPNESYYLSAPIRHHLREVGSQPDGSNPAGTFSRHILDRLLIDLSWNSSRLEGNTYSLLETQKLILFDDESIGKHGFETQMILNHKKAISFMVEHAEEINFNQMTICNIHAFLAHNLLANPAAIGRLRSIPVGIGKASYQPTAIPQILEECFNLILQTAQQITDPFEQAFFAMVHLPYLQPFEDVNKRVSRLAANIPLIKNNLAPLSFVDVSNDSYINGILGIYELNKVGLMVDIFVWAYERSAYRYSNTKQTLGEPDKFKMKYGAEMAKMIQSVVARALDKTSATNYIQQWSHEQIKSEDQVQFVGMVEYELLALHPGSIFRFGITLEQFEKWQVQWNKL